MTLEEMQERFPLGSKVRGKTPQEKGCKLYYVIGYNPIANRVAYAHSDDWNGNHNLIKHFGLFSNYLMIKEGVEASGIPLNRHGGSMSVNDIVAVKPKIDWVEI